MSPYTLMKMALRSETENTPLAHLQDENGLTTEELVSTLTADQVGFMSVIQEPFSNKNKGTL